MSAFEYIAYKVTPLDKEQTIAKLRRFCDIDKYRSFYKILPAVINTTEEDRNIISALLDDSCRQLLYLLASEKRPHKATLKKVVNDCMKAVAAAQVRQVNKDFAYELCWYLSDIAGLDMRKSSQKSEWGYWDIVTDEVKAVHSRRTTYKNKKDNIEA